MRRSSSEVTSSSAATKYRFNQSVIETRQHGDTKRPQCVQHVLHRVLFFMRAVPEVRGLSVCQGDTKPNVWERRRRVSDGYHSLATRELM